MIRLKSLLREEDVVKNKKTGNVYMVQKMDPNKHDKPTPAEIDKAKVANGGKLPTSDKPSTPTPQKPQGQKLQGKKLSGSDFTSSAEKKPDGMATVNGIASKTGLRAQAVAGWADENGVNLSKVAADLQSKKLKPMDLMTAVVGNPGNKYAKQIIDKYSQSGGNKSDVMPKLKDLMPGADFSAKPLSQVTPIERQKISTVIDDLAKMGAEAKAKGEKAPNFNLCQVSIPGTNLYCDGNKGIERGDMPQFKGTPQPGSPADKLPKDENGEADTEEFFKQMLNKDGIKVSEPTAVPPDRLKATQSELVGVKVAGMSKVLADPNHPAYEKITAPIYVSNDGYVLDGHHRWAAVVAHNASNPKNQIPMNVRVVDEPIEPLVKRSNEFAEKIGIRAKKADTGAAGGPAPIATTQKKKSKLTKRVSSEGEEMGTLQTKKGSTIFGVEHDNVEGAKQVIDDVKNTYPKDTKIVFMGEGGDSEGNYVEGSEQEFIHDELKKHYPNFTNESWDGDEMDVYNDQSELYKHQEKKTGLPHNVVLAGNWASMVGQGDDMAAEDYLDDEGKQFLQDAAKEAGLPPIKKFDNPTKRDKNTLYRLAFPEDNGDKPTKVNDIQVAFNDARDENLVRKMKKWEDKGYKVVSTAGYSHIDLLKKKYKV